MAGLLGLPFPNGLIPQAPFHTESLCVTEAVLAADPNNNGGEKRPTLRATHVVEQRVSNLAQGLLTLVAMTGPLLTVLHLVPQGVLAGLFFIMGFQALEANGITAKILFLLRDGALTSPGHPLNGGGGDGVRRAAVWVFVAVELVGFGATFAITQTVAAVGFPVFILLLIPLRAAVLPRFLRAEELAVLDEPTASPFTMESVGGTFGGGGGSVISGGESGEESEKSGKSKVGRSGTGTGAGGVGTPREGVVLLDGTEVGGGDGDGPSEEELAERGESKAAGVVRRRPSAVRREGSS